MTRIRTCVKKCIRVEGKKLFKFPDPNKEPARYQRWVDLLCVNTTNIKTKYLYACSDHFSGKMFQSTNIKRCAIPDISRPFEIKEIRNPAPSIYAEQIDELKREVQQLRKQNDDLNSKVRELCEKQRHIMNETLDKLPEKLKICVKCALDNYGKKPYSKRYPADVKNLAVRVYKMSYVTYSFLKRDFEWPTHRLVQKYIAKKAQTSNLFKTPKLSELLAAISPKEEIVQSPQSPI